MERETKGSAIGACACSGFAVGWFGWSQAFDPGYLRVVADIGSAIAIVMLVLAVRTLVRAARGAGDGADDASGRVSDGWNTQTRRRYRIIVLLEATLIAAGAAVLGGLGHASWIPAWAAIVVAAHFYPLARLFQAASMRTVAAGMLAVTAVALVAVAGGAHVPAGSLICLGSGWALLYGAVYALRHPAPPAHAPEPGQSNLLGSR